MQVDAMAIIRQAKKNVSELQFANWVLKAQNEQLLEEIEVLELKLQEKEVDN